MGKIQELRCDPTLMNIFITRLAIMLGLTLVYTLCYIYVVVPWSLETEKRYERNLYEGTKAYASVVKLISPTLPMTIRGLNTAEVPHNVSWENEKRIVSFGSTKIFFNEAGRFQELHGATLKD